MRSRYRSAVAKHATKVVRVSSGTNFCRGGFAPCEPEFGAEWSGYKFWAPNLGSNSGVESLAAVSVFPVKVTPQKFTSQNPHIRIQSRNRAKSFSARPFHWHKRNRYSDALHLHRVGSQCWATKMLHGTGPLRLHPHSKSIMYVCVYVCVCMYVCMYVCVYIYICMFWSYCLGQVWPFQGYYPGQVEITIWAKVIF